MQCRFCSRSNPADAMFCEGCGGQLNLAPCPYCKGVNEVTATVCHACNGELVATTVEGAFDASPHLESGPESSGFEARREPIGTPSAASERPIGSSREARPAAEAAAGSRIERITDLIRQGPPTVIDAYSAHRARDSAARERTLGDPSKIYSGSAPAAAPRELSAFGMDVVDLAPQAEERPAEHTQLDAMPNHAAPAEHAVQALPVARRSHGTNAASFFTRRRVAAAAVAGVLLAGGVLLYDPSSRSPVHPASPAGSAAPAEVRPSTESRAGAESAAVQGESAAAIPSVPPAGQPALAEGESPPASPIPQTTTHPAVPTEAATAAQPVEPAPGSARVQSSGADGTAAKPGQTVAACAEGLMALGLCPSESGQPAAQIRSANNVRQPIKDEAACNEAAAALGLCTSITTKGKD
jgi:hypothetical protein